MLSAPPFVVITCKVGFVGLTTLKPYTSAELAFANSSALAELFITNACPAVPKLAGVSVKSLIDMLANWNVPNATIEIISLTAAALARTKLFHEVSVKYEFANFIPL